MNGDKHTSKKEYNKNNPWREESTLRRLYYGENMSMVEIGEKFDISHQAVLYWFKKHNINRRSQSDYWSGELREKMMERKPDKEKMVCENCGDTLYLQPYKAENRKYCSQDCAKEDYSKVNYKRTELKCDECGGEFYALPNRKYCSLKCYHNNIYEGGNTLAELYRKKEKQTGWLLSVYERDGYTCQVCGDKGGELQAHHITQVSDIVEEIEGRENIEKHELFGDVNNGITLCIDCHDAVHYGDLTLESLDERNGKTTVLA